MANYTLNIDIKENDLKTIWCANEKIVIVKHTAGNTGREVAWISFRPFMHNTIQWENSFSVYASNTEIQGGATINKLRPLPSVLHRMSLSTGRPLPIIRSMPSVFLTDRLPA